MKAVFIRKTGGPEVIEFGEVPDPKLGKGTLRVKTIAVTPDHMDSYIRLGKYPLSKPLPNPYILGQEMVGEVVEVCPTVTEFQVGDKVWSLGFGRGEEQGTFSEFVVNEASLFYQLPEGVDPILAVASLQAAATVCRGIIASSHLKREEILFVNGAAGNVGTALIQLGKARGARVLASTTGKEKIDWCREQGAEYVYDYKKPEMEQQIKKEAPGGIDVFWDTSWQPDLALGVELIGHGGRIVVFSGAEAKPPLPVGSFYQKEGTLKGFSLLQATREELSGYSLIINRALEEGILKAKIAKVFPLKDTQNAFKLLESKENVWGKIVITV